MSRTITLPAVAILITACGHDFELSAIPEPELDGETGILDTGELEDTGEPWEEEEETPVEEEPTEPDPEVEDPPAEDDCEDTSDLVYVIDKDSEDLYLFHPDSLSLERLGTLDCDYWSSPASMGVARDGLAYVRYADDQVHAVDLDTLECQNTSYRENQTHFGSFGMGYSTNSADTWRDQLYVANEDRLARLDTESWEIENLGILPSQSELTGNADGELWGFLPLETPAELVRLGKVDGEILETIRMPGFPSPYDIDTFAFATWGGDFWLFVRTSGMGSSTDVYQVTPDGEMTMVRQNIGINVVGAGVSTCAPTD
jgi:hypothetical protein